MNLQLDDTIAALASAPGPGERGIIRLSGPEVKLCLSRRFVPQHQQRWQRVRTACCHPGTFTLEACRAAVPVQLYLWPGSRSYTGQPLAELHVVGSPPLVEALLADMLQNGARAAEPGEFTLRAFLAGRVDLMQAEAVLGVVDAHGHRELETALAQLAGGISAEMTTVRTRLVDLVADLEAGLDFVEDDIEFVGREEVSDRLNSAQTHLEKLLAQATDRMRSTARTRVALAGLPNAGKSTLFNALAGRQAALVSPVEGTTRDYLSVELDWRGIVVELIDTAGWETRAETSWQQAQTFRSEQLNRADAILWCTAADLDRNAIEIDEARRNQLRQQTRCLLVVATKCDLPTGEPMGADVRVSAQSGLGLGELIQRTTALLTSSPGGSRQFVGTTAARCRESLEAAVSALQRARAAAASSLGDEIVALDIRDALEHLGRILGVVYTDDILDRIFSKFCIGK